MYLVSSAPDMKLGRVFIVGLLISFLGALPLGTLNVTAMQLSVTDGIAPAFYFSLGALLVEIIYVRLSLVAMDWVRKQKIIFRWLEWITFVLIIALAIASFITALSDGAKENKMISNAVPRFWMGVLMSAINPVQIPFWFGWSTILFTKKILKPSNDFFNVYIAGIGIGTFLGNAIFIFGGRILVEKLNKNQSILHWIIGGIFAITALIQLWRMITKKDAAEKLDHP
jgi:threonine/homoserine/homoserine lactone efflux protein